MTESIEQRSYGHVIAAATERPWAILESKLNQYAEVLALRLSGFKFSDEEIEERMAAAKPRARTTPNTAQTVAVIPVYGTILPKAVNVGSLRGGTGLDQLVDAVNAAAADPKVTSILLDFDSPGGQVDGVPEAAAAIRAARAEKTIVGISNTMAASAGYWLFSQCTECVVSPSAEVGSIGVFAIHNNIAEMQRLMGIDPTIISAGKYKTELSPLGPLSEEARAYTQANVDHYYGLFVADVARGRGAPIATVRDDFGQGRMITSQAAVKAGMADRVATFDQTLARMLDGKALPSSPRSAAEQIDAAVAEEFSKEAGIEFDQVAFGGGLLEITEEVYEDPGDNPEDSSPAETPPSTSRLAALREESRLAVSGEKQSLLRNLRRITE